MPKTEELRGLQTVRVNREEVLAKLRENRDGHRAIFEEAVDGWHKAVVAALDVALKEAKAKKHYRTSIRLPEPKDHTADYDRVIEMLGMSLDKELELSAQEFAQFVMDDWQWMGDFLRTSSNYTVLANDHRHSE